MINTGKEIVFEGYNYLFEEKKKKTLFRIYALKGTSTLSLMHDT